MDRSRLSRRAVIGIVRLAWLVRQTFLTSQLTDPPVRGRQSDATEALQRAIEAELTDCYESKYNRPSTVYFRS